MKLQSQWREARKTNNKWFTFSVLFLLLAIYSCKSYKKSYEWRDIEIHNGGSFEQKAYGEIQLEECPILSGNITNFISGLPIAGAKIEFLDDNKVIKTIYADDDGRFTDTVSAEGFWGTIKVSSFGEGFTASDVYIIPTYKNYIINIKTAKIAMHIEEDFKNNPKMRREIMKKLEDREKRKLNDREQKKQ